MFCQQHKTHFETKDCPLCSEEREELIESGLWPYSKTQYCAQCNAPLPTPDILTVLLGETSNYCQDCEQRMLD